MDDAVGQFEDFMGKLRGFDIALGYVELLKEMDTLRYCVSRVKVDHQLKSSLIVQKLESI